MFGFRRTRLKGILNHLDNIEDDLRGEMHRNFSLGVRNLDRNKNCLIDMRTQIAKWQGMICAYRRVYVKMPKKLNEQMTRIGLMIDTCESILRSMEIDSRMMIKNPEEIMVES